jgi:hypothetical protein
MNDAIMNDACPPMTNLRNLMTALLAALPIATGCASGPAPQATAPATKAAPGQPRVVTDLSQLSSAPTKMSVPTAAPTPADTSRPADLNSTVQSNIDRFFVATAPDSGFVREPPKSTGPTDTTLLNPKAEQFSDFSYAMLNRTLKAVQGFERDRLAQRKLRDDIERVVLVAVMTPDGKLTEIEIEHHSGDHAVDKIVIDACKEALWSRNPPAAALSNDGGYRLRVEGLITNYHFDRDGKYTYTTRVGLALL